MVCNTSYRNYIEINNLYYYKNLEMNNLDFL